MTSEDMFMQSYAIWFYTIFLLSDLIIQSPIKNA